MNDSTPFDTVGDEPVEARIVSWVLGEASAFEAAELERLCEERPELLVFRRRMRVLNGLLTESETVEPDRSWKLPEEKRKVLDEIFGEKNPARTESDNESRIARSARRALLAIAACVMLTLFLGAVFSTGSASIQKARKVKQAAQYSLPADRPSTPVPGSPAQPASAEITNHNTAAGEEAYAGKVGDLRKSEIASSSSTFADRKPAAESKNAAADDKSDLASTDGSRRVTRDDNVARPARPRVVPGAKEQLAESDADAPRSRAIREAVSPASGTSVDGIPAEQGQIASGGVTNGLRMGDEAINRNNIDAILNNPNRTADEPISPPAEDRFAPAIQSAPAALAMELGLDGVKKSESTRGAGVGGAAGYASSLADRGESEVAKQKQPATASDTDDDLGTLAGRFRRAGKDADVTAPASELDGYADSTSQSRAKGPVANIELQAAKDLFQNGRGYNLYAGSGKPADSGDQKSWSDPGSDKPDPLSQASAQSDDLIRSNAAETNEQAGKVDQVRRGLYLGEGNLNLGKYDEAKTEYENVLRTDPYNSAARRGLEKVNAAKTDYYRAAYDHTRAELLMQVDKSWELKIPEERKDVVAEKAKAAPAKKSPLESMEEIAASEEPYSTFSLNINDASFQVAKAALDKGERPDPAAIKVEQFYNAVDYGDPAPASNEPVAASIEQSAHPVIPGRNIVRVALKTAAAGRGASQPLRLTLLVDQSGSMVREDRRTAMADALKQLGGLLTPNDHITVVGFSRESHLLADNWTGDNAGKLGDLVNQTASEGGTNLEQAINLGEQMAARPHPAGEQNRIVLFTDGAANLGNANPERLAERVKALRQQGIAFDIAGIGADGVNDRLLSELARNGNGRYYVVGDTKNESFARQLAGAFRPAAENVKVQVRFNPDRVGNYKLIGFEKDRLKTEDFRNDSVDAAELAAEEAGVAIYQVETLAQGGGEIGEVSVRFRDTSKGEMVERKWTMPFESTIRPFDRATPSMQLAGLSMLAAEKLKGGPLADAIDFKQLTGPQSLVKQFYGSSPRVADMLHVIDLLK